MGAESDPKAVLDSHARVYGVEGLRVVDASSFALLPPGHPQSVVCKASILRFQQLLLTVIIDALAEKVADLIKNGQ